MKKMNKTEPTEQTLKLVGITVSHYIDLYMAKLLLPGLKFSLQRESKNPYDSNAVSVWLHSLKIGYLSREDAINKNVLIALSENKQVLLIEPEIHREFDGARRHYVKIKIA